jgi:hypothetical protein
MAMRTSDLMLAAMDLATRERAERASAAAAIGAAEAERRSAAERAAEIAAEIAAKCDAAQIAAEAAKPDAVLAAAIAADPAAHAAEARLDRATPSTHRDWICARFAALARAGISPAEATGCCR